MTTQQNMKAKHPCAGRVDDALHHPDGSHRTTPTTTRGRGLEAHERNLRAHLHAVKVFSARYPRIQFLTRLNNSRNGNPRFKVTITPVDATTITVMTKTDIADAYGIESLFEHREPVECVIENGLLVHIWKAGTR